MGEGGETTEVSNGSRSEVRNELTACGLSEIRGQRDIREVVDFVLT